MLGTKYRGRRKGIPIRAGSVLQARSEAGLTLAQVADGKITRTAIHLIEKGRTQPSLESLQLIARQTRKPIEFFLVASAAPAELTEQRRELAELDMLTATRDFQAVVDRGLALLGKPWSAQDAAVVRFYVGQALCRLVRPSEALDHIRSARTEFEQFGDEPMAVEAMDWESCAMGLMDDPEALPLANAALERSRKLDPKSPQTESRILGHIAGLYVVSQSWVLAIRYYEAAVEAARGVKDLLQLAKMHHGLAAAYQRMQLPAKARQQYDKALSLYSLESDMSATYRVENDLGDLLLQQGQLDSAEQHLQKALAGSNELNIDRRGRGHILLGLGEVELRRGHLSEAARYLQQALETGAATGEKIVLAEANVLLGQVDERHGEPTSADHRFETAIAILESLGMPDRLRDAHMDYAELLKSRQDIYAAAVHWKLAAEIGKLASLGLRWSPTAGVAVSEDAGGTNGRGPAA